MAVASRPGHRRRTATFERSGPAVAPLPRTAWQRTQPFGREHLLALPRDRRLVRRARLIEESEECCAISSCSNCNFSPCIWRHMPGMWFQITVISQPMAGGAGMRGAQIGATRPPDPLTAWQMEQASSRRRARPLSGPEPVQVGDLSRTGGRTPPHDSHYQQTIAAPAARIQSRTCVRLLIAGHAHGHARRTPDYRELLPSGFPRVLGLRRQRRESRSFAHLVLVSSALPLRALRLCVE